MRVERVTLRDYRNIAEAELEFGPRFTVLHGHNGAGKTNVLEAIYLVSTLRSFRTSELGPLVRRDAPEALVSVKGLDEGLDLPSELTVRLSRRGTSTRRAASADGKSVRSAAAFYGRVRAVLFTPEDLAILRGSPSGRRQFLDRMVFARERAHIGDVQTYEKLLRSRNHVLKREDVSTSTKHDLLDTYEVKLAEVGARVWSRRTAMLDALRPPFVSAFAQIFGRLGPAEGRGAVPEVRATYASKLGPIPPEQRREALAEALRSRRSDDLKRRVTTIGPHRDDLEVVLDGQPAGTFASQGQSRALVLAFKLAELRSASGTPPLLLLDDVSSELDPPRSAMLYEALAREAGQCVVTTTDARYVTLPTSTEARFWAVSQGGFRAHARPVVEP